MRRKADGDGATMFRKRCFRAASRIRDRSPGRRRRRSSNRLSRQSRITPRPSRDRSSALMRPINSLALGKASATQATTTLTPIPIQQTSATPSSASQLAAPAEGQSRTLTVRWTLPSSTRHREVIPGAEDRNPTVWLMRVKVQTGLVEALRKAYCWLDELLHDPEQSVEAIAARERKIERSFCMTNCGLSSARSMSLAAGANNSWAGDCRCRDSDARKSPMAGMWVT